MPGKVRIEVKVALDDEEIRVIQAEIKAPRKPTVKQLKDFFGKLIDDELDRLLEAHQPEPDEEEDDNEDES